MSRLICCDCRKHPDEIEEYVEMAKAEGCTPQQFVAREEGTLNPANGHFCCTECYIKRGTPTRPGAGWKAP